MSNMFITVVAIIIFIFMLLLIMNPGNIFYNLLTSNLFGIYQPNYLKYRRALYIILLLLFLFLIVVLSIINPYNLFTDYFSVTFPIVLFFGVFIFASLTYYHYLYSEKDASGLLTGKTSPLLDYFMKSMGVLFGLAISGLFIWWIISLIGSLSTNSSIVSLILNILIVAIILGIAYKMLTAGNFFQNSPLFRFIVNIILYIPCLVVNVFELIFGAGRSLKDEYASTNRISVIMLVVAVLLIGAYLAIPYAENAVILQGGEQLVNQPIYINDENILASYESLNNTNEYDYQYGISFWVYIDSAPPSTNASYDKYTSILNYGNKPNVMYKASTNTLLIVEDQKDVTSKTLKGTPVDLDENGFRIIYKKKGILLQKWNNIIINYSAGTLDVFYNGELVKSAIEVVPYMKLDALSVGSKNGIHGGICNVVYFSNPLSASQIYYLYNTVKDKTPPTLYNSNQEVLSKEFT